MPTPLTFEKLKPKPRAKRAKHVRYEDLPHMMLTPEFLDSPQGQGHLDALHDRVSFHLWVRDQHDDEASSEEVLAQEDTSKVSKRVKPSRRKGSAFMRRVIDNMSVIHDYIPWSYDKLLPKEGGWIRVNDPPSTVITVPPFSQWYAVPDPTEVDTFGFCQHRARVETPAGPLWIMPREYVRVGKVSEWLGREEEGIFLRYLSPEKVRYSSDTLAYIMSRGIPRREALSMIVGEVNDPHFCWFEVRPDYAEMFGKPWPSEHHCPFAMRPEGRDEQPQETDEI